MAPLKKFVRKETSATAKDYGLIAVLMAVVMIASIVLIGKNLITVFQTLSGKNLTKVIHVIIDNF
jgi:pilus assembly protein Flp/PilA